MTLNEIRNEVASLGFESNVAIDSSFVSAVRRALSVAYTERGVHAKARIFQSSPKPRQHIPRIEHTGGKTETLELLPSSYSLEISGVGEFCISDGDGERRYVFNSALTRFTGRINGVSIIRFEGEFRYTVYDLCTYDERFPEDKDPPRYGRMREYDLSEYIPDFLSAVGVATNAEGCEIEGVTLCAERLSVPYAYSGEINLKYRKRAPAVSEDSPDAEIEVPGELAHLIPLLTAAYVWLDDDSDKAQYYMSLYREGIAALKVYSTSCLNNSYTDTTGWA